jgi:hypothetical protein
MPRRVLVTLPGPDQEEKLLIEISVNRTDALDQTIEEREVLAYVRGFEERTTENRGYGLSHEEYVEVLEEAMALYRR